MRRGNRERWVRAGTTAVLVGLAMLTVAGCGDDGEQDTTTASEGTTSATEGTAASTSTPPTTSAGAGGDVVEVPPSDPIGPDDQYVTGTAVEVGQVADMGAIRVTVTEISPGSEGAATVDVAMTVENHTDGEVFVPDIYTVCTDDGRAAVARTGGDLEPYGSVGADEAVSGVITVDVIEDCTDLILQARSLNEATATEPIAQWAVPGDAQGA